MNGIESQLFAYPAKCEEIKSLEAEARHISSAHISKLDTARMGSGNPVENWYLRREKIVRRIVELRRGAELVEKLLRELPDDLREILEERYFRGIPWRKVWIHRYVSRITVWRKRKQLLKLAGQILGGK